MGSIYSFAAGLAVATVDNNLGLDFSARQGYFDPDAYNAGLDVGNAVAIVQGALETLGGVASLLAEGAGTVGSGGTLTFAMAPAAAGSLALTGHGIRVMASGASNLVNQTGRVRMYNKTPSDQKLINNGLV